MNGMLLSILLQVDDELIHSQQTPLQGLLSMLGGALKSFWPIVLIVMVGAIALWVIVGRRSSHIKCGNPQCHRTGEPNFGWRTYYCPEHREEGKALIRAMGPQPPKKTFDDFS